MRHLVTLLLLAGCADQPDKPDNPCHKPYSETVMRCAKKPRVSTDGMILVCRSRWPGERDCYYVEMGRF